MGVPTAIAVEIDRDTGAVCIDKYVSLHDAGRILNPALLDGQVCGGSAMAVGAALYEKLVHAEDGGFLTGSLLDYALPTASMIPELEIVHQETPSPVTPLGAKGIAEGNSMSTPVCIATCRRFLAAPICAHDRGPQLVTMRSRYGRTH